LITRRDPRFFRAFTIHSASTGTSREMCLWPNERTASSSAV